MPRPPKPKPKPKSKKTDARLFPLPPDLIAEFRAIRGGGGVGAVGAGDVGGADITHFSQVIERMTPQFLAKLSPEELVAAKIMIRRCQEYIRDQIARNFPDGIEALRPGPSPRKRVPCTVTMPGGPQKEKPPRLLTADHHSLTTDV